MECLAAQDPLDLAAGHVELEDSGLIAHGNQQLLNVSCIVQDVVKAVGVHVVVPGLLLTQNTNQLIELDTLNRRFVQPLIVGGVDFGNDLAVLDFLENAREHAGLRRAVNALDGCGKVVNGDRRVGKREVMLRAKDADLVEVDITLAVRMVGVVVLKHVDEVDVLVVLVHDAPSTCADAAGAAPDLPVQVDPGRVGLAPPLTVVGLASC